MGKRKRERGAQPDQTDWSVERTLADVEAEAAELSAREEAELNGLEIQGLPFAPPDAPELHHAERSLPAVESSAAAPGTSSAVKCACGSEEFLLEAYLAVVRGRPQPEPVELESLTCPNCGREYEAIWLQDGRVARGEYRGQTDID